MPSSATIIAAEALRALWMPGTVSVTAMRRSSSPIQSAGMAVNVRRRSAFFPIRCVPAWHRSGRPIRRRSVLNRVVVRPATVASSARSTARLPSSSPPMITALVACPAWSECGPIIVLRAVVVRWSAELVMMAIYGWYWRSCRPIRQPRPPACPCSMAAVQNGTVFAFG